MSKSSQFAHRSAASDCTYNLLARPCCAGTPAFLRRFQEHLPETLFQDAFVPPTPFLHHGLPVNPIPDFSRGQAYPGTSGLLPAIAQDAVSGRVLMVAWMDQRAWEETLATGQAVYFSRSRGELWRKGETSGHRQRVMELRVDCDADAILLLVQQTGAACHEGYESCFFRRVERDSTVGVVDPRLVDPASVYGKSS